MKRRTKAWVPGIKLSGDDTQNHGGSANTNPGANQTVPHNPLLQAGYRERGEGGVEKVRESEQDGGGTHRRHGDP